VCAAIIIYLQLKEIKGSIMNRKQLTKSHPFTFFALIYAMSAPFWIISIFIHKSALPDNIPVTDIGATLSPAIAACFLIYKENGWMGLKFFLARIFDYRRISSRAWFLTAILLLPILYVVTYFVMRILEFPVPLGLLISPALAGALVIFLIAATVEELGYSAYASDSLLSRYSAFYTSILIGIPWAFWHLASMLQMGQSWPLIVWGLLATIAFRVITLWFYINNNYSLFIVILAHAMATTARSAFPGGRSAYELSDGSVSYAIIILAAICITLLWGPKSLKNFLGR
jgi:membrane protease YdiL (CAAX protease family)